MGHKQKGFSLIETMIGVVVMTVTIFAAGLFVVNTLSYRTAQSSILNMNVVRKELVSTIENPLAWSSTINHNAVLGCFANVLIPVANDCSAYKLPSAANNLKLYDSKDNLVFDSTLGGTNGLNFKAQQCNTFSLSPGDPSCPIQPTITFHAVCPPAPALCVNPPVIVRVDFLIATGQQLPNWLNVDRFSIEIMKLSDFCPVQKDLSATIIGPNTIYNPDGTTLAPYVGGNLVAKTVATGGIFLYTPPLNSVNFCARTQIVFNPSVRVFDPLNPNRVCLGYTAASCEFEWLETSASSWVLNYNGVPAVTPIYTLQSPTNYPPSLGMKFLVQNGMVSFYSDDYLLFYFPQNMTQNFIPRFIPAPLAGAPLPMTFSITSF